MVRGQRRGRLEGGDRMKIIQFEKGGWIGCGVRGKGLNNASSNVSTFIDWKYERVDVNNRTLQLFSAVRVP